jgi:hypothetical protein
MPDQDTTPPAKPIKVDCPECGKTHTFWDYKITPCIAHSERCSSCGFAYLQKVAKGIAATQWLGENVPGAIRAMRAIRELGEDGCQGA